ncbi:MAG: cell wall metabolism sensor histidine kinase WalK [Gemmataceae bacterium]|nr:cell wall metabolism sensor histidine kinase WalK [Gemmataceae bacterium]
MKSSLRRRILLTVAPLVALIVAVGVSGLGLLDNLGRTSEEIIRDNYVSLRAMADLADALAAIERTVLSGEAVPADALAQAHASTEVELGNITIAGEGDAARVLAEAVGDLARACRRWPADRAAVADIQSAIRRADASRSAIRSLNEDAMYQADRAARDAAGRPARVLAAAVAGSLLLAALAIWWLQRSILVPIRTVTHAAQAIGSGDWQQVVPVVSHDEIGKLADSFNAMATRLRAYRQSGSDQLSRARLAAQATVDAFPDPVIVLDPTGRVELANPAATRLFGIRAADSGVSPVWLPPEPIRPLIESALKNRRPAVSESLDEAVLLSRADAEHAFLPQARPIAAPDGETLGIAVVLSDVTRFRLLDQLKSDWVATVSHELKTPLTSVQLAVHVLLEEAVGPLEPKQIELLLEARTNAERLHTLIQQLLALAKLEHLSGALSLVPADPGELLRAAADAARTQAEDRQVAVVVEAPLGLPRVCVDTARLSQSLNNLVNNALRHTGAGGRITLTAAAAGDSITLSVADTGVGIPDTDVPHIFDRFYRVAGRDDPQGTGLGLAIVREVAEAHGGRIDCASTLGAGTTMTLTLPAEPPT